MLYIVLCKMEFDKPWCLVDQIGERHLSLTYDSWILVFVWYGILVHMGYLR